MTDTRKGVVLTFGENVNDARAVAELLVAANPNLAGRVHPRPRPMSLTRTASPAAQDRWVAELRRAVAGFEAAQGPVIAVIVHRDADCHDPAGAVETNLNETLKALAGARAVVPVQMTEAWWFLFPEAVEGVRPRTWRGALSRKAVDVELIVDPKRKLKQLTRGRGVEYSESDSVAIASAIRAQSLEPIGASASFGRLRACATAIVVAQR